MRGDFLRTKALFMTFIILASIFSVYNFKLVTADETNYCCEQTLNGEFCQYDTLDQCNQDFLTSATTCEQATYCKGGCCVSDIGKCSKNVPKSVCENTQDYTWYDSKDCEIAQCEKQCCNIANSLCSYTTAAHCETIDAQYPEIDAEFATVEDEYACIDLCSLSDKGCCVSPDSCTYDTKEICETPEINLEAGTGFYENRFCSELNICGSTEHFEAKCVGEDVYWFDSFGNQEGVIQTGDRYWDGESYNVEGQTDGECDYTQGTWCGYNKNNEPYCKSVNCDVPNQEGFYTFDGNYYTDYSSTAEVSEAIKNPEIKGNEIEVNVHDGRIGGERYHGESWCLYESPAGNYLDRPGSQHYRSYCYFGEEIIESCRDFREEICLQNPYDPDLEKGIQGQQATGSACIDNNIYDAPINVDISTVPKGNKFWTETVETTTCAEGSVSCEVNFIRLSSTAPKWKCIENCECLSEEWMINASKVCSSKGDCGANYNIIEKYSNDAFYITKSEEVLLATGPKKYTAIGYDLYCADEKSTGLGKRLAWTDEDYGKDSGKLCVEYCTGFDTKGEALESNNIEGDCPFYTSLEDTQWYLQTGTAEDENEKDLLYNGKSLKNAYGAQGGLLGISELMEIILIENEEFAQLALSEYNKAILGQFLTLGIAATSAVIFSAAAGGGAGLLSFIFGGAGAGAGTAAASAIGPVGWIASLLIIAATVLYFILTSGGETTTVTITANCEPWLAPAGGDYCELCDIPISQGGLALDDGDGNILPGYECSEYKCKSLGAACEYITENSGTNREKCYSDAVNDVNQPIISLDKDIFDKHEYEYELFDRYVEVNNIHPYTQFEFGILTDELSQCKFSESPLLFEEMTELFPDSYYSKAHNQTRVLTPNEEFNFYIQCQDASGNPTIDAFTFKITTIEIDDVQPPLIEATDIQSGSYIAHNTTPQISIFINEPVQTCKWSNNDEEYEFMPNIFLLGNSLPATQHVYTENYKSTILNVSLGENYYYFACEDYNNNINTQNYEYMLIGTEQLNIDKISPNGTLFYNDVALQIETSIGAENGIATCYYDNIAFFESNSTYHEQLFEDLGEGEYSYNILCQDIAGNQNITSITFTVDVDETPPELTDIYKKDNTLFFELNEDATCEYYYESFIFGEGTSTSGSIALTDISSYYIICEDIYNNDAAFTIEV